MASRRAIRTLASCAALAATVVSLAAAASSAADTDQWGNRVRFATACNPTYALVEVPAYTLPPLFLNGVAWVDYFGFPVFVSQPFRLTYDTILGRGYYRAIWPMPSA